MQNILIKRMKWNGPKLDEFGKEIILKSKDDLLTMVSIIGAEANIKEEKYMFYVSTG